MLLSVSLLNSKDRCLAAKILNELKTDYIHIDVMDGKFVSQKEYTCEEIEKIADISNKKLDVHLMMEDPMPYIERLKELPNINNITIHLEIDKDIEEILKYIKEHNIKCGLAIKPNTDIEKLKPYLNVVDIILIMTVEPGLGGQPFIEASSERISRIKKMVEDYNIILEVDGGINNETIKRVLDADISVVGSYITTSDNMEERINKLFL